MIIMI